MEREDTAARLMFERDELLQELRGARSGQNRSAEEVCVVGGGDRCCSRIFVVGVAFFSTWDIDPI